MPWSLSQYNLYRQCPLKYKFRQVDRLEEPPSPAAERGTGIHAQLEGYLKTGRWTSQIGIFARRKAEAMRKLKYLPEIKLALDNKWRPVDWKSEKAWVRGVVDAMLITPVRIHMGEWKSGKIYDDHVAQRELYLCMVLSAFDKVEDASIETIYVDQEHAQESALCRADLGAAQEKWANDVGPMLRDTFFSPRPGPYCRWCSFAKSKGGPCDHG